MSTLEKIVRIVDQNNVAALSGIRIDVGLIKGDWRSDRERMAVVIGHREEWAVMSQKQERLEEAERKAMELLRNRVDFETVQITGHA